jgi:hypothetical protein
MCVPADPPPEPVFEFVVDPTAPPGDVLPALADLLLDLVDKIETGNLPPPGSPPSEGSPAG